MKVSNCLIAKMTAYSLLIAMTIMLVCLVVLEQTFKNPLLDCLLIIGIILLIIALTKIRTITYEFSGGCVTIRKIHPFTFKKFISPDVEFPQTYIRDYNVQNNMVLGSLVLKIKSKRNKSYAIKIRLFGFSHTQRKQINSSLISIVSKNNFNPTI